MTDYCNSGCQRHRPAATTNRYAPGHFQTHTNTPKQACVTQVCHQVHMLTNKRAQWVNGHAHTVSHGKAGHVDASRGVYMSAHSLKIAGVTQKTQTDMKVGKKQWAHKNAHTPTQSCREGGCLLTSYSPTLSLTACVSLAERNGFLALSFPSSIHMVHHLSSPALCTGQVTK